MQVKTDIPITITRIKKYRKVTYLLTVGSDAKTIRGEVYGYRTGIMYLLPAKGSDIINVCKHATPECIRVCLNTAGRGQFNSTQLARVNRTILFTCYKHEFWYMLVKNIEALKRDAVRRGLIPVIRLNGLSDIPWEKVKIKGIAHNTGGGLLGNIPRIIPENLDFDLYQDSWHTPQIFNIISEHSKLSTQEMLSIYNMGIGMVICIEEKELANLNKSFKLLKEKFYVIGRVKSR